MADGKEHIKRACRKHGSDETRPYPHLKPLSVYSHMILCKATSLDNLSCSPSSPSWNLKVELSNNQASVGLKRRLDDSCLDETYDTPLKKPCLAKRPPSGTRCVFDSSDTVRQVKLVSSQSSSVALKEIERIEKTLSDQKSLSLDWINGSDKTLVTVHSSSPVIIRSKDNADVFGFDYDVEELMCLSPIGRADVRADGLEDLVQICQPSYEEPLPVEEDHVTSVSRLQTDSAIQVMFGDETNDADSFDSTLPLQVQVKSKVVLPNKQQPEAVKATAHKEPEKKAVSESQRNVFRDVPRPVVLYSEKDWEKEKKVYVDSVTRHMTNNAGDGVMTELLHLMNTVANQGRGSDGRKWQHPSDLTRRNYRLHSSSRLLSLDEWQSLNYRSHRRFAKVPQIFRRSPVL